ncbi:MAG: tetratricopeptide repeat protein [Cytophagales bacterium]|nr:tetratricopeptide repeat protein [Bernardetiaceae bacterium]MDW8204207.1 tetratricopeptide repeat protein [Cytophagales bacterium]
MELNEQLEVGILHSRNGNYAAAIEVFEAILRQESRFVPALYHLGYNHFLQQHFELAMHYYEQALSIEPYNAHIISERGVVLFHQNRKEESLAAMNLAQELDPHNPYRYASRAFVKDALGDLHGAIEDYRRALELDPDDAIVLNNLGLLEEKLGYQEAAKKKFIRADELAKKIGYTFKNIPPKPAENTDNIPHQQADTTQPSTSSRTVDNRQPAEPNTKHHPNRIAQTLQMMWRTLTNAALRKEFWLFIKQTLCLTKTK